MAINLEDSVTADINREWNADSLLNRFQQKSRGHKIIVEIVEKAGLLQYDYEVSYDNNVSAFKVLLSRSGGFFEAAFCFIEQWISNKAAKLDFVPDEKFQGMIDVRFDNLFPLIHQKILNHLSDAEIALEAQKAEIRRLCPEGNPYDVRPSFKVRIDALSGLQVYLKQLRDELRSGWITLRGAEIVCALGYGIDLKEKIRLEDSGPTENRKTLDTHYFQR